MPKKPKERGVGALDSFVTTGAAIRMFVGFFFFFPVVCFECLIIPRCVGGMGTWSWNGEDEWRVVV